MVKTMWIGPKDPSNKVRKMRWRRVIFAEDEVEDDDVEDDVEDDDWEGGI